MDLSSLNMENIESIMSSVSAEDMDRLSQMASELLGGMGKEEKKEQKKSAPNPNDIFSSIDPASMMKIMNIIGKLNSAPNDPRCSFLESLKPLLSEKRQHKADEAIKMLQLMSMLPYLQSLGE